MNVREGIVGIPLSILDTFVQSWELDPVEQKVRVIGPKTKEHEYPYYSTDEDKNAKEFSEITDRILPSGDKPSKHLRKKPLNAGDKIVQNQADKSNNKKENCSESADDGSEEEEEEEEEESDEENDVDEDSEEEQSDYYYENPSSVPEESTSRKYNKTMGVRQSKKISNRISRDTILPNKNNKITHTDYRKWRKRYLDASSTNSKNIHTLDTDSKRKRQISDSSDDSDYYGNRKRRRRREHIRKKRQKLRRRISESDESELEANFPNIRRHRAIKRAAKRVIKRPRLSTFTKYRDESESDNSKSDSKQSNEKSKDAESEEYVEGEPVNFNKGFWKN